MVAALAVTVFTAGMAQAQYKPAPPTAAANPNGSPVQIIPAQQGQPKLQPTPEQSLESAKRITREDAQKMVKEGKAVYIDVRGKDQYDIAHIPGAINIPLGELQNRWRDLPVGKYLITYCA
ncbi:MAG TPA: rhodanese-like domain-containing protein [Thermoanaerobaculia bacterium]|jgi:hypothetical protein